MKNKTSQLGQTLVEYIMLLTISVALVTAFRASITPLLYQASQRLETSIRNKFEPKGLYYYPLRR